MVSADMGAFGALGIAVAFGLVISAMIYAVGHVSGAHFNPAVTVAFAATGHFPWNRVASYVAAQVAGAVLAAQVLRWILGGVADVGATSAGPGIDTARLILVEVLITAILMFVIASVATDGRAVGNMAGSAIGAAVAFNALWAGPLTGASMNPARSIGPAIAAQQWADLPYYILAPIVGAIVGAFLYELTRRGDRPSRVPESA